MTKKPTSSAKGRLGAKDWIKPEGLEPDDKPADPEFAKMLKRKPAAPVLAQPEVNHAFDELLGLVEPDWLD